MKALSHVSLAACGLLSAGIAASIAFPAVAQTAEEVVVIGRYGRAPDNVRSLSKAVSYADLNLGTDAGKREFHHRISLTARYLCDKLGESDTSTVTPSCRDAAVKDAMARAGTLEASLAPRGTTWVAGPAWKAPYPAAWVTTYP